MKKFIMIMLMLTVTFVLTGCTILTDQSNLKKVGLILDGDLVDHAWNQLGYEGLLHIERQYDVDTVYKTNISSEEDVIDTVDEFVKQGVNLIFGHSNIYGKYFADISHYYPDVHFVYFNGSYHENNVSSFNFESHAMGFFGGMVASEMTETEDIGVIAAYEWQPEVEGFYEGAKFYNNDVNVHIQFLNNWNDSELAYELYEEMRAKNVDVFYPTGDHYSQDIIQLANADDLYSIGYVTDQLYVSPSSVLTSTVQHVDKLYTIAAERFQNRDLYGGLFSFDFQDGVISLGTFNNDVSDKFKTEINQSIKQYVETNLLPNQVK